MDKTIIGIDISKHTFDIALSQHKKALHKAFANNAQGYEDFLRWLKSQGIQKIHGVMEATSNYGLPLACKLYEEGHTVSIINPFQIKAYGRSLLQRHKTDKVDAQLILNFARTHPLRPWQPQPKELQEIRDLSRCLETLLYDYTRLCNRLEHALQEQVKQIYEDMLKEVQEKIDRIETAIQTLMHTSTYIGDKMRLLMSIPGVGQRTAAMVLGEIGDIDFFSHAKQLAAFFGLTPRHYQSGISVHARSHICKVGRADLRRRLYFPTMTARRFNPVIKDFINNLRDREKPKMVALIAGMRKLIHIIYGVLKHGQPFKDTRPLKKAS